MVNKLAWEASERLHYRVICTVQVLVGLESLSALWNSEVSTFGSFYKQSIVFNWDCIKWPCKSGGHYIGRCPLMEVPLYVTKMPQHFYMCSLLTQYTAKTTWLKWPWVKATAVSGFIEQNKNTIIINQPPHNPSQSIEVQTASSDTFLLANINQFIYIHLLAIIRFRTR